MRAPVASLLALSSVAACAESGSTFIAWPELGANTLSFLMTDGLNAATATGPFGPEGPPEGITISEGTQLFILSFDEAWLRDRHARVDAERLMDTQLRARPSACQSCQSTCRDQDDGRLFQPVDSSASVVQLVESAFVPSSISLEAADLWLQLPARWDCATYDTTMPYQRISTWPPESLRDWLFVIGEDAVLAGGPQLRRVGDDQAIPGANELFLGAVPWGTHHALAIARNNTRTEPGRMLELDLADGALDVVREQALELNPNAIFRDERGVVILGRDGQIATSTDGASFRIRRDVTTNDLHSLSRVSGQGPEYFIGLGRGGYLQGDPWNPTSVWTEHSASTEIDYPIEEIFEVRGPATADQPDGRWLWARSSERGSFVRPFLGEDWRPVQTEPPRMPAECTQGTDECGFVGLPQRTAQPFPRDGDVVIAPEACRHLLIAHPERGCADSIVPSGAPPFGANLGTGMAGVEGGVMVLVEDGVLFVPLD